MIVTDYKYPAQSVKSATCYDLFPVSPEQVIYIHVYGQLEIVLVILFQLLLQFNFLFLLLQTYGPFQTGRMD